MTELTYETIRAEWADELEALEHSTFSTIDRGHLYQASDLVYLAENFPEGGFVVRDGDEIVAMGLGHRTTFDFDHPEHDLDGVYTQHDPQGDWYYGTTIAVRPSHRGRGIGGKLYELRKDVARRQNLRGIVAGGVLPGFAEHRDSMAADEYIKRVSAGELYDPTLTFQIENGFRAHSVLTNYMDDPTVGNNAVLIVWDNPDFVDTEVAR